MTGRQDWWQAGLATGRTGDRKAGLVAGRTGGRQDWWQAGRTGGAVCRNSFESRIGLSQFIPSWEEDESALLSSRTEMV